MESPSIFRLRRRDLAKVVALAVLQALTLAVVLLSVRALVDHMVTGPLDLRVVYRIAALLAVAVLANALLRGTEFNVSEKIGYEKVRTLRMGMYRHLQGHVDTVSFKGAPAAAFSCASRATSRSYAPGSVAAWPVASSH